MGGLPVLGLPVLRVPYRRSNNYMTNPILSTVCVNARVTDFLKLPNPKIYPLKRSAKLRDGFPWRRQHPQSLALSAIGGAQVDRKTVRRKAHTANSMLPIYEHEDGFPCKRDWHLYKDSAIF